MSDSIPFDDFQALLDGRLDAAAAARLTARLAAEPALRAEFDAYRDVHAFTAPAVGSAPSTGLSFERLDAARRAARVRRLAPWLAMAATLLVAAAGVAAYVHAQPSVVALHAIELNAAADPSPVREVPSMLASYRPVEGGRVNWLASLPDARALSRATGRPLFVWVYHQECPMCIELDRDAMRDGALQAEAAKFVPVKLDVMTASPEVQGWCRAGWPYLATQTADGKRLVEFAGEMDTAKIREALARGDAACRDALPWSALNEIASRYADADAARAAGRYADAFAGYDALQRRLGAAGRADDPASATFRADVDSRVAALRREARDALIEAKQLAETDEAAGARRLSEAAERFRGTPFGNDLAEVEKELRATGRFPVLVAGHYGGTAGRDGRHRLASIFSRAHFSARGRRPPSEPNRPLALRPRVRASPSLPRDRSRGSLNSSVFARPSVPRGVYPLGRSNQEMNAMKKLLVLAVLAAGLGAAVAAVPPAFAGGCCGGGGGGCCAKSDDGFECMNQCPLAQEANKHRASGRESFAVSTALRATYAATVQKNLARI